MRKQKRNFILYTVVCILYKLSVVCNIRKKSSYLIWKVLHTWLSLLLITMYDQSSIWSITSMKDSLKWVAAPLVFEGLWHVTQCNNRYILPGAHELLKAEKSTHHQNPCKLRINIWDFCHIYMVWNKEIMFFLMETDYL